MAINFPTSLDALTNPVAGDATNSVSVPHATQHSNLNDAVEALEARVGITGSAVSSSLTYRIATLETSSALVLTGAWTSWTPVVTQVGTPTLTNNDSTWTKTGKTATVCALVTFTGSGTTNNNIVCSLPVTLRYPSSGRTIGTFIYYDQSAATSYSGQVVALTSTTVGFQIGGTSAALLGVNPNIPVTSGGDTLGFTVTVETT